MSGQGPHRILCGAAASRGVRIATPCICSCTAASPPSSAARAHDQRSQRQPAATEDTHGCLPCPSPVIASQVTHRKSMPRPLVMGRWGVKHATRPASETWSTDRQLPAIKSGDMTIEGASARLDILSHSGVRDAPEMISFDLVRANRRELVSRGRAECTKPKSWSRERGWVWGRNAPARCNDARQDPGAGCARGTRGGESECARNHETAADDGLRPRAAPARRMPRTGRIGWERENTTE